MTEQEFRKAMTKVIVFIIFVIIILIGLGIFVFGKTDNSKSVFKSEDKKNDYKQLVEESTSAEISSDDVESIDENNEFNVDGDEQVDSIEMFENNEENAQ